VQLKECFLLQKTPGKGFLLLPTDSKEAFPDISSKISASRYSPERFITEESCYTNSAILQESYKVTVEETYDSMHFR
jgi:hypothetical protein